MTVAILPLQKYRPLAREPKRLSFANGNFFKQIRRYETCHDLRYAFATYLLESGYDIRTSQELLGHADLNTTMIYTPVVNKGPLGVKSPADLL